MERFCGGFMKSFMKNTISTTFFLAVLCAGLLTGCKEGTEVASEWTVTFDLDGGAIDGKTTLKVSVKNGDSVGSTTPSNPTKNGYTFSGWYTEKNGKGEQFLSSTKVNKNTAVYAYWQVTQITITYNANGGTGSVSPQTAGSGVSVTLASGGTLSRAGYTFSGWNTNASGTGTTYAAGASYSSTSSITLYAVWITAGSGEQITITYDANGGTGSVSPQTAGSGVSVALAGGEALTRAGYTFSGWNTNASGTGTTYAVGTSYSSTSSITLYAVWITAGSGEQVTITYDANGGTGSVSPQTAGSGISVALAGGEALTRAGYTFSGWNTNASGTGTTYAAGASYSSTSSITLYAKWVTAGSGEQITITYDANGGTGSISPQTAGSGVSIALAGGEALTRAGYTFSGWNTNASGTGTTYAAGASYSSTSSITLYAVWSEVLPSNVSLAESLAWISANAVEGGNYTITLQNDESIAPHSLSYGGKNISITLKGDTERRTVSLDSTGSLFRVESGVTLTLENNVVLQGRSDNTDSLVWVSGGGTLVMNGGAKISGNTATAASAYAYAYGGGVYVGNGGTFEMSGGEISDNTAYAYAASISSYAYGGGVYVYYGGTFEMSGGEISGNSASNGGGGVYVSSSGMFEMSDGEISGNTSGSGGGVYVSSSGTFEMSGGEISGNSANYGGGVYNGGGTFEMSDGEISGNSASNSGGGVFNGGTFEMSDGEISGNSASTSGGGVYNGGTFTMSGGAISGNTAASGGGVSNSGTFTMNGGAISGNTATSNGGGVSHYGTFTMSGGEIGGNTATSNGGGVYVYNNGTFIKQSGGTIYGLNAGASLRNTAANGHAVYVSSSKVRNNTADVGVSLDSAVSGADGGWETTLGSIQIDFGDPSLSNVSLWVNQSYGFNTGTNYASWTWYWDGEVISGATSSSYTLTADKSKTPGIYELSVVVVNNAGEKLSARCRVVVKAH
jgi:uncharacterized repeat protein (TIGR02543 family)